MDTALDRIFPNDQDSVSIFSKVIFCDFSHGSSDNLYSRCKMNFSSDFVQTDAPQFVDLGFPAINTSNELSVLGTLDIRIITQTDGSHWLAPDHVFGEATAVRMSAARSEQDYIYQNGFEIWRGNQEFERQNILMSQSNLNSTTIGTDTINVATSHLDSTTIGKTLQKPHH